LKVKGEQDKIVTVYSRSCNNVPLVVIASGVFQLFLSIPNEFTEKQNNKILKNL